LDLLTQEGEHEQIALGRIRSLYFVREFNGDFEPERKAFLSRPKLDGLWIRLRYTDGETLEGVVPNDLLSLLDNGVQLTPPDLSSNTDRIFVPRSASSLPPPSLLAAPSLSRPPPAATPPPQPPLSRNSSRNRLAVRCGWPPCTAYVRLASPTFQEYLS